MSGHAYTAGTVPATSLVRRPRPHGAASALGVAGLCVAGLALVWVLAALVPAARLKDAVALYDFTLLSRPGIDGPANFLLHLLDPIQFILWGVALVAVAIARERPRVAVAVAVVMGLAPLTSEALKPLLAHPHIEVGLITSPPRRGRAATPPPRSRWRCQRCWSRHAACDRGWLASARSSP